MGPGIADALFDSMHVLIVFAHPNEKSFCRAVLERFTEGLKAGGHTSEVVDLYAIDFDPVLRTRDWPNWIDETLPADQLERANVKQRIIDSAGGPIRRFLARRRLKGVTQLDLVRLLQRHKPRDVAAQQQKVARADALAFISPVYFVGFPAILKGWIERVFSLGFAFAMTTDAWRGELWGRRPLLHHQKALIINTTLFNEKAYATGLGEAMKRLIDDFALHYPGIREVEHVYFYSVASVDDATRAAYLQRAFDLGKDFKGRSPGRDTLPRAGAPTAHPGGGNQHPPP